MRKRGRLLAMAAGLVLAAGVADADGQGASRRSGTEVVEAVDVAASTVTLDSTVFHVTPHTVLRGSQGQPIALGDLRALSAGVGRRADAVRFRATKRSGSDGWLLELLEVIEEEPA